jgi:sporulation protein YlmC with PRC-barrel domain
VVHDVRVSDLLGDEVLDVHGMSIGRIHDVRCVQNGSPIGVWGAALRVDAFIVGTRAVGVRLGFDRADVRGPWALKAVLGPRHRKLLEVPWSAVAAIEPDRLRLGVEGAALRSDRPLKRPAGRTMDVGLALLDRQILDPQGRMSGNVDDLELSFADDGPPWISAILAGPGALAGRLGGRVGGWIAAWHERLQDRHLEGPARISFGIVVEVGQEVVVSAPFQELPTAAFEDWVRVHVVERIPGS